MTKAAFNTVSSRYKAYNKHCYAGYIMKSQANLRRNPSQFWSFVKTKYKENGLPSVMALGETVATFDVEKCELFARHFASVFRQADSTPSSQLHLETVPRDLVDIDVFNITEDMLKRGLLKLKSSIAPGPGGIPPVVFKRCFTEVSAPLLKIFNLSTCRKASSPPSGKYPSCFLFSKKIPSGPSRITEESHHFVLDPNFSKSLSAKSFPSTVAPSSALNNMDSRRDVRLLPT